MHNILLSFVVILSGIGLISAAIPSSIINTDVVEIEKISDEFLIYSPAIARGFREPLCKMVPECCPKLQSKFLSILVAGGVERLFIECFGETNSSKTLANLITCSPATKLTTILSDPQLIKYISIINEKPLDDKEYLETKFRLCSKEELHSTVCDWNTTDLQRACNQKILENIAEQGDNIYKDKVHQIKEGYVKILNQLKKEFKH